jgi:hypothetical protein
MHRGIYILRYPSLDQIFGRFALSFLLEFSKLPLFLGTERYWKYTFLKCKVDPILSITEEFQKSENLKYNYKKVALLKEMGRAAYQQPISEMPPTLNLLGSRKYSPPRINKDIVNQAKIIAKREAMNATDLLNCPVCGEDTLVRYYDFDQNLYEEESEIDDVKEFLWCVYCHCCSFQINKLLTDISKMDLPIEDYWS